MLLGASSLSGLFLLLGKRVDRLSTFEVSIIA